VLTEDQFIELVDSIQRAMMVEPFCPDIDDVVTLIGERRLLHRRLVETEAENERLRTRLIAAEKANDVLLLKIAEMRADQARLTSSV
jgi:hypothetical protein